MGKLNPPVGKTDHTQGNTTAVITLVEYGDYQCGHCGHAYPILKRIQQEMGENLLFVFRNFPIQEAHPDAFNAALSAEAAGLQEKFWEMHDLIYQNQDRLDWQSLVSYADSTGIDLRKFEVDIETGKTEQKVEADFESGIRSGVNGTPSFYINGTKYDGDWEYLPFLKYLQSLAGK